jgi:hypothetical protein
VLAGLSVAHTLARGLCRGAGGEMKGGKTSVSSGDWVQTKLWPNFSTP